MCGAGLFRSRSAEDLRLSPDFWREYKTSGSWRDSVSCDTFIIFEADVTSPLPSPKLFFDFPTIFGYNRMWNDICLIPGHYCNYRAAAAAAHVNHDGAEEGARRTHA